MATVHVVSRRAYYEAGGVSVPPDAGTGTEEYLTYWSNTLTDEANSGWIAEDSDECVGFLVAGPPVHEEFLGRPVLELIAVYLLPKVWGTGIADALHERFTDLLRGAGRDGALDVWSGNLRALSFYRRHGWAVDGRSRPGPADRPFIGLRLASLSLATQNERPDQ